MQALAFQDLIAKLQLFWADAGCLVLQPYDMEMGAGTFHPATVLYPIMHKRSWNVAYVQPVRRPVDSRFGKHPNRTQHYYQFQVLLKPTPEDIQARYLKSLEAIGLGSENDIRFVEDDWKCPTLGAYGLGWEVQCNGMEISQFTYMQQIAGKPCSPPIGEVTYGLERIAMYLQGVDSIAEIAWGKGPDGKYVSYKDLDFAAEEESSQFNLEGADVSLLNRQFNESAEACKRLLTLGLPIVAYECCIRASHLFNLLDSRGALSVLEREKHIKEVSGIAGSCIAAFCQKYN